MLSYAEARPLYQPFLTGFQHFSNSFFAIPVYQYLFGCFD